MINLLPPELKDAYRYAHRNVSLVRWAVAGIVSLVGLAAVSTAGLIYMEQAGQVYTAQISTITNLLQQQNLTSVQTQVKNMSNSLKLAVQVLSREVLFSKLLQQLATITPSNVVLTDLQITPQQNTIDLTAMTSDYNAATQLQINLADPKNQIFGHADIVSITCTPPSSPDQFQQHYPCTVTIHALFAAANPFLFINDKSQ